MPLGLLFQHLIHRILQLMWIQATLSLNSVTGSEYYMLTAVSNDCQADSCSPLLLHDPLHFQLQLFAILKLLLMEVEVLDN